MPIRTGAVTAVGSKAIYRQPEWSPNRIPTGTRYTVWLHEAASVAPVPIYTTDQLRASACLEAKRVGRPVTVSTRGTRWGEEIVSVDIQEVA